MKKGSKVLVVIVLMGWVSLLSAQFVTLEHYTVANTAGPGISDEWVEEMIFSPDGKLVCATIMGGLSVWDGLTWTNYSSSDWPNPELHGWPSDQLFDLAYDEHGDLWICSYKYLIQQTSSGWILHDDIQRPRKIVIDQNGTIWVGTDIAGFYKRESDGTWSNFTEADGLIQHNIQAMAIDDNNDLWLGTYSGLSKFDGLSFTNYTTANGLVVNDVKEIGIDGEGRLWVGSWRDGFSIFDGNSWSYIPDIWNARDMYLDSDDTLWIAATNNIYYYANGNYGIKYYETDFGEQWTIGFSSFVKSEDGTKYIGTLEKGLLVVHPAGDFEFNEPDHGLLSNETIDIDEDNLGRIWLLNNRGLSILNNDFWFDLNAHDFDPNNSFNDLYRDDSGIMWIATTIGAIRFQGAAYTVWDMNTGLISSDVATVFKDNDGNLWFSTTNGVSVFDGVVWKHITMDDGLADHNVFHIDQDQDNVIWLAGSTMFYEYFNGELIPHTIESAGLTNAYISDLLVDGENDLWLATNRGLARYDGFVWSVYNTSGLPDDHVSDLAMDPDGNVWVATLNGIAMYNGTDFEGYGSGNGLLFDIHLSDIFFDHLGQLWIGTSENGVFVVDRTTDLEEIPRSGLTVRINPNPVNHGFTVESNDQIQAVTIYDLKGRKLFHQAYHGLGKKIQVRNTLPAGMYLCQVQTGGGIFTQKLIIAVR